jgi:hypothetical protein
MGTAPASQKARVQGAHSPETACSCRQWVGPCPQAAFPVGCLWVLEPIRTCCQRGSSTCIGHAGWQARHRHLRGPLQCPHTHAHMAKSVSQYPTGHKGALVSALEQLCLGNKPSSPCPPTTCLRSVTRSTQARTSFGPVRQGPHGSAEAPTRRANKEGRLMSRPSGPTWLCARANMH